MDANSVFVHLKPIMQNLSPEDRGQLDNILSAVFMYGRESGHMEAYSNRLIASPKPKRGRPRTKQRLVSDNGLGIGVFELPDGQLIGGLTRTASARTNVKATQKYNTEAKFLLVCAVEAEKLRATRKGTKLTDKGALIQLFLKLRKSERKVRHDVESRLAPLLSRSRSELRKTDEDFVTQWGLVAQAWANNT